MNVIKGDLSARDLIDKAKDLLGVRSHYALAQVLEVPAGTVQRYYRLNSMPRSARSLILRVIEDAN